MSNLLFCLIKLLIIIIKYKIIYHTLKYIIKCNHFIISSLSVTIFLKVQLNTFNHLFNRYVYIITSCLLNIWIFFLRFITTIKKEAL